MGYLNDLKCRKAKPKEKLYKLNDGGGLYLIVQTSGNKHWRLKYHFLGKEKSLSLGQYPIVGLSEARDKRAACRRQLDDGQNPSELRRLERLEQEEAYTNNFEANAREWHSQRIHTWKPKHGANIMRRLEENIFPYFGNLPIRDITPPQLLSAVRKIEAKGHNDLAHRVMQTCGQIFRYAVATGKVERDITSDLKGALQPARSTHYPHLSEKELPEFLRRLDKYETHYNGHTLTKLAFKLLILTFVRSGEIRGAKWEEFDWQKKQWRIPAERMKMNEQHIVPLATQSIELLKQIYEITGHNYAGLVFPSFKHPRKTLSDNTFNRAIQVLGYKGQVVGHGFRSTASTILNENGFRPDIIERQLAHCERDQVRAAYNHAQYLPERAEMMQYWADFLDETIRRK